MTTTSVHFPEQHWCRKHGVPCTSATIWNECKHTACIRTEPYSSTPVIKIKKENKMTNREMLSTYNNGAISEELVQWFDKNVLPMTSDEMNEARVDLELWLKTEQTTPKAFTEYELIKAFRDKFMERRAIGILEIEELIGELFR